MKGIIHQDPDKSCILSHYLLTFSETSRSLCPTIFEKTVTENVQRDALPPFISTLAKIFPAFFFRRIVNMNECNAPTTFFCPLRIGYLWNISNANQNICVLSKFNSEERKKRMQLLKNINLTWIWIWTTVVLQIQNYWLLYCKDFGILGIR